MTNEMMKNFFYSLDIEGGGVEINDVKVDQQEFMNILELSGETIIFRNFY